LYFLGIIDVLTFYNAGKKAAHAAKTVKHGVSAFCKKGYFLNVPKIMCWFIICENLQDGTKFLATVPFTETVNICCCFLLLESRYES